MPSLGLGPPVRSKGADQDRPVRFLGVVLVVGETFPTEKFQLDGSREPYKTAAQLSRLLSIDDFALNIRPAIFEQVFFEQKVAFLGNFSLR